MIIYVLYYSTTNLTSNSVKASALSIPPSTSMRESDVEVVVVENPMKLAHGRDLSVINEEGKNEGGKKY